ncbi:signal peptidase I SipW [Lederbergia graminis]|uniref:Signal peptidase I n=1 Tax=Lederbergia graminis TaxID=735518 RepID=A0ABW0LGS4_9BACI
MKSKTLKVVKKWSSRVITTLLTITLIFMIFVVISSKASGGEPSIFGFELKTVLSGSMEPGIKTGSIIAVKPGGDMNRFKENDIITFLKEKDMLVTHRVVEVIKNNNQVMYRTKGDNNGAPDSELVLSDNVVAEYKGFTIPFVGYLINFAQSKNGNLFLLILPGLLLLAYSAFTIWRALSELEKGTKIVPNVDETTPQ